MTYPPQQPGWQQGPYGQGGGQPQPGGQFPGSGGFQQPGGQFPQSGGFQQPGQQPGQQYPQGQYPQGQYGQQPGWGPNGPNGPNGPEKKSKTGLWVGLSAAAVVIVAFVITAFVAPGFLLSDDKENNNASQNSGNVPGATLPTNSADPTVGGEPTDTGDTGEPTGGDSAEAVAEQVAQGFNDQDQDLLNSLVCSGSESNVKEYIDDSASVQRIEPDGTVEESGDTATAKATVTLTNGESGPVTVTLANKDGWCWDDLDLS